VNPFRSATLFAAVLAAALVLPFSVSAADITVFAASSLKTALDKAAADWTAKTGNTVTVSYGGTPQLALQIEQGAPADLFLSASKPWMDTLSDEKLIDPATRADLWGNTLVLVSGDAAAGPVTIDKTTDLAGLLKGGKLSMALVGSVPAGQYGKEALESLGLWASVEPSVAQSENVRVALELVAKGEATLGIVYGSDAKAEPKVHVIGTFPDDSHKKIVYPGAVTASAADKVDAAGFLTFLATEAQADFTDQGFTILAK
jgi:molybdate transport system substrate-binding protein